MKFILNLKSILFFFFIILIEVYPQSDYLLQTVTDTIPVNFENRYSISRVALIPFSESIVLRSSAIQRDRDYKFNYSHGYFALSDTLAYSIFDTLFVSYQTVKLSLKKEYKRRSLVIRFDDRFGDTIRVVQSDSRPLSPETIFGPGIEKSGTLVRGFTVGTTRDLTLNSGLRLQLAGKLSDDIEVVAALTDENTPIQPEGTTERLEELDKVFIQLKHKNATGTFGDYYLNKRTGEFGSVDRKLQGLLGEFDYENVKGFAALAGSKGKFNSFSMNGSDGVQGPYRLTGLNNERDIIIIAGTEKVFLDGEEMRRGEGNDYTIEYANAQVTFTPSRLITSQSRITIDYEYTDRRFARNFFATGVESNFFNDKLMVKVQYVREGDDQDAPIDIILSENDKEILGNAGDDRNKAVKPGVIMVEPDSLGIRRGVYEKKDTTINDQLFTYYVYNPGAVNAIYNVSFSYMGEGNGDYIRRSIGNYEFIGIGSGGYLPVIFLPMPELKQVANINVNIIPLEDFVINLEYAGSLWDKNRFSKLDEGDDYGYARSIQLKMNPKKISFGELNLGSIGFSYKDRFVQDKFTSPDRFNDVEFNRNYNVGFSNQPQDETLREVVLNYLPINDLNITTSYGYLKRGENFKSNRFNNSLILGGRNQPFLVDYNIDYVESENPQLKSKWLRQKGNSFYTVWKFKPGIEFLAEDKKDRRINSDSLLNGSLRFTEINPYLELFDLYGITLSAKYSVRDDYIPLEGFLFKEARSTVHFYEMNYSGIPEVNSNFRVTLRNKKYSEIFRNRGFLDNETILIRSQNRFNFFKRKINGDIFYEVSTQRSAKLERVFVKVERGAGNYRYLGDLNNNGIADENEFEPTLFDGDFILINIPTDELFPVIDLKASTRWKINLGDFFEEDNPLGFFLRPLSTETLIRLQENSKEENTKKIYLLHLSSFQNEATTIRGSDFIQQDFFLFENNQELSIRLRYVERNSLNQFAGGVERGYNRERSMRIRFQMVQEISNQTEIINETDNVSAPVNSNRRREVISNSFNTDFSYRPIAIIEVGFRFRFAETTDELPVNATIININSQSMRFNLSLTGKGRLRVEFERNELVSNTEQNFIPFEVTKGNLIGKNFFWRLNFDYRISTHLQSTISYDGRMQGGGRAIHTARAEVRAYF